MLASKVAREQEIRYRRALFPPDLRDDLAFPMNLPAPRARWGTYRVAAHVGQSASLPSWGSSTQWAPVQEEAQGADTNGSTSSTASRDLMIDDDDERHKP